VIILLESCK